MKTYPATTRKICTATITSVAMVLAQSTPFFATRADAADITWLGTGTGGAIWSDGTNWVGGIAPVANDGLIFTGTSGTANTNDLAAFTAIGSGGGNAITFNNPTGSATPFVLDGNAITLNGNILSTGTATGTTINFDMVLNADRTINTGASNNIGVGLAGGTAGVISGGFGLIKAGAGTLTLRAANTFTGDLSVNAGTLTFTSLASLGAGTAINLGSATTTAGVLNYVSALGTASTPITLTQAINLAATTTGGGTINNGSATAGVLVVNGALTNAGSGTKNLQLGGANTGANDFQSIISDGGAGGRVQLVKADAGTWRVSGANTFTGQAIINRGTLSVNDIQNAGVTSNLGAAIGTASVIRIGNLGFGGTLDYTGSSGAQSTDRQVQIGSGNGDGGAGINASGTTGSTLTFSNAAFNTTVGTGTGARTLTLGGTNTGDNTISGVIADNIASTGVVSVTKAAAGKWVLGNAANTFTGALLIDQGTLSVNSIKNAGVASGLGAATGSVGIIRIASGANAGVLIYTGAGDSTDRQVAIGRTNGAGSATIQNDGLTGALVFTNPAFNASVFSTGTANGATRTLVLRGTNTATNDIQGTITDNINATGTGANGIVNLTKNDAGTWQLSGANTYTGATTVTAGTLILNNTGALPAGGVVNVAAGFLQATSLAIGSVSQVVNATGVNGGVSGTNAFVLLGGLVNNGGDRTFLNEVTGGGTTLTIPGTVQLSESGTGRNFTLGGAGNTLIDGPIVNGSTGTAAASSFRKVGSGTITVTNQTNSYTGGTVISGGTLALGTSVVIPNTGTVTIRQEGVGSSTAGRLDLNGNSETIAALTFGSTAAGTAAVAPVAGQTPSVVNTGGGSPVLTLGGNVTYNAGAADAQNGQAEIAVTLGLGGANRTFIVNNSTAAPVDLLVSGAITNGGTTGRSITKQGLGTLKLTNSGNSYTGGTVVENGVVQLGASDVIPNTGAITVRAQNAAGASGTLDLNGFSDTIASLTMGQTATGSAGGAGLTSQIINTGSPTAVLNLNGNVTGNAGSAGFNNGTATISANLGLGSSTRTFTIAKSDQVVTDMLVSGIVSGTGTAGVTKLGTGILEFTNANTYGGTTTVTQGALLVNNTSGSATGSGAVSVGTAGGIGGTGSIAGLLTVAGVLAPGNSAGTITLNGGVDLSPTTSTLEIEVFSTASFDQVNVVGTVTLGGNANVSLLSGFTAIPGDVFTIIDNDFSDLVSGTFLNDLGGPGGLAGTDGSLWTVNYAGGSGNDVQLTLAAVPEPGTIGSLIGGLGVLLGLRRRKSRRA